jgi:hypothetical protein
VPVLVIVIDEAVAGRWMLDSRHAILDAGRRSLDLPLPR